MPFQHGLMVTAQPLDCQNCIPNRTVEDGEVHRRRGVLDCPQKGSQQGRGHVYLESTVPSTVTG